MEPITRFTARTVVMPIDNIDTDQIIPARFLKTTSKVGLGNNLFSDWRYDNGVPREDFILNQESSRGAAVLVAGDNFGCGSSREHAPWALMDYGFKAVVSTFFADIFRNNSLKNGLLPVMVTPEVHAELFRQLEAAPDAEVTVDLQAQTLTLPDGQSVKFPIDPFARECLLAGVDQLGFLLAQDPLIAAYEASHPARVDTLPAAVGAEA